MIEKMLDGVDVRLSTDYFEHKEELDSIYDKIIYTGTIDEFFNYEYGKLEYRTLRFETEKIDCANYQGNAVVNYTEREIPYTRIIEHKHFEIQNPELLNNPVTIVTKEYPATWQPGDEPYYAVNNERNSTLYKKYAEKAESLKKVIFGGRLGMYKYFDMDVTIAAAWNLWKKL